MDERNTQLLEAMNINIPEVMERFMDNEALLWQFLDKFARNPDLEKLQTAIAQGDKEEALSISHNLKGLTGNLGLAPLNELFVLQVRAMREQRWDEAVSLMTEIMEEYRRVASLIQGRV